MAGGKAAAVAGAIRRLGVPRDVPVMVHSAFRGFARDGFTVDEVLGAWLDHCAPGTLVVPTMSWRFVKPDKPFFDELETPCNTGVMAETFRTRHASHRSLHPTHSAAAIGRLAGALTAEHHLDDTPCSDRSPFGLLARHDGWVVMFGITMDCCTLVHHVDEKVAIDLYLRPAAETETYACRRRDGTDVPVRLRRHLFLARDYYQFQDLLAAAGRFRTAALDSQIVRAFRARDLVDCATKVLRARPDAIIARPGQRFRRM